jgi:hypothetical protein
MVEHLPTKHSEALSSNPSIASPRKKKKKNIRSRATKDPVLFHLHVIRLHWMLNYHENKDVARKKETVRVPFPFCPS